MDEIYQASIFKRISASLLDGVLTILLAIGMFMLLANGAVDIGFHNLALKLEQYRLQDDSRLFNVDKDGDGNILGISLFSYDESKLDDHTKFVSIIHDYYFLSSERTQKSETDFNKSLMLFDEKTLSNGIYSIPSLDANFASYTLLDQVTDVSTGNKVGREDEEGYRLAIAHFFTDEKKGVYYLATTEFTNSAAFQSLAEQLAIAERIEILICTSVSALLVVCMPILINKHGETAFMHVLSICFVDSYGYQVKMKHKIIRATVTLLLYASSIYLFGVPMVINAIVMFATPSKRSLLDFAANEASIDKKTSVIIA